MKPPTVFRRALAAWLPAGDRESLLDELDALFSRKSATRGRLAADFWYVRQTLALLIHLWFERLHDAVGGTSGLRSDVQLAFRTFRRRPAFTVSFVLTLAIGTGVIATVYTAARWVLLRPVPGVQRVDELATLRLGSVEAPPHVSWSISHLDYLTFRDRLPVAGQLAALTPVDVDVRPDGGAPLRVSGALVSSNYFAVLGVALTAGRDFVEQEETTAGEVVAVVSQSLARRISSGSAVGTRVRINGTPVLVVGEAAPAFRGAALPGTDEIWLPLSALHVADPSMGADAVTQRGDPIWRRLVARVPAGSSTTALSGAANGIMENIRAEFRAHSFPATHFRMQVFAGIGLDPSVRASVQRTLGQLGIVATLLLLLSIANLANLSLIESTRRSVAGAVRVALGATRARLATSAMVEAALLGIGGTVVALWLAYLWSGWYQGTQLTEHGGALTGMQVGPKIAGLTIVVAFLATGIAFLRPAAMVRTWSIDRLLRRTADGAPSGNRLRALLISAQVALSLVLLVSAALLGRTVRNLRSIELGFQPDRVLTFSIDPHLHGYESQALDQLARRLERQLVEDGGFRAAGFVSPAPLRSSYVTTSLYGSSDPAVRPLIAAGFYVSPGFLAALGARTVAGDSAWRADSGTAVLSRGALARLFPAMSPHDAIGMTVPTRPKQERSVRIAAIIEDVSLSDVTRETAPTVFLPLAERWAGLSLTGFVDASGSPRARTSIVRRVMAGAAPDIPLFDIRSARSGVDLQFADRNAMARAAGTLAVIGLILAAIGLYAVISAVVATRRREIGIRGALGAAPDRILRRVLAGGLVPVMLGLPVGVAGSILLGKLLAPQLFGLNSLDPVAYGMAVVLLIVAALGASLLPAWRATRISPAEVLRDE